MSKPVTTWSQVAGVAVGLVGPPVGASTEADLKVAPQVCEVRSPLEASLPLVNSVAKFRVTEKATANAAFFSLKPTEAAFTISISVQATQATPVEYPTPEKGQVPMRSPWKTFTREEAHDSFQSQKPKVTDHMLDETERLYAELGELLDRPLDPTSRERIDAIEVRLRELEQSEAEVLVRNLDARLPFAVLELRDARAEYERLMREHGGSHSTGNAPSR